MTIKVLSRLAIIGNLIYDAPSCILEDIIESVGITLKDIQGTDPYSHRHKLLIVARKVTDIEVDMNTTIGLRRAATFINPDRNIAWNESQIRRSLTILESFAIKGPIIGLIPNEFELGYQEPSAVDRINVAILYRACIELGIRLSYDTTGRMMYDLIRLHREGSNLKDVLLDVVDNLNISTLRSLMLHIALQENCNIYDKDEVKSRANQGILTSILPSLSTGTSMLDRFDPNLPEEYYSKECLEHYASTYEVQTSSYRDVHRTLSTPTWHRFKSSLRSSDCTPIYRDNIDDLNKDDVYQYGIAGTTMDAFSEVALIGCFESNLSFIHPIDPSILMDDFDIDRLGWLSSSALRRAIHIVRSYQSAASDQQQELIRYYQGSSNEDKVKVVKFFNDLHRLGLAMRGWDLESDILPITESRPDNQYDVDVYVTTAMAELESSLSELEIKNLVNVLPTLRMTRGHLQLACPTDKGSTIEGRLKLIRSGNHDEIESCIRISSNWIVASSYTYLHSLGERMPYNIVDLREIS